ncbi:hypothetical protein LKR43_11030 [Pusillimonas sp. MFBS29]|uniref:nucleoside recognition domain-containing protein n=1 Tax=Pusillimonas sp. MFBS29 TaxID=2886690 RepID=UPI001D10470F|nr:nucleoside recognition domain-containing protein [Pusillimonas sp. MFBS29]MCC2596873.1 hypothetical protein [Pusillimonas sp. MFBS29]
MRAYALALLQRCWRMFVAVTKLMLPVMVVVQIGQQLGLVDRVGELIAPAMALLNLPPEAGIVWAATVFTGIYGGIASLAGLAASIEMNAAQVSTLGAMMLFAHAIPVEQAIVRRAGASFNTTAALRLGTAILYGTAVSWFCHLTGTLSQPMSFEWLGGSSVMSGTEGSGWMAWAQSTAFSLALTFAVIVVLVLLLDILDKLGITRRITTAMLPLLKLSGLDARVAPVTTVGVLMGLTYGGALIIEEAKKQNFSRRTRFLALSWMSLSHGLIEDTLLIVALGADIWVVLVGRVLVTLVIIALLARLTRPGSKIRREAQLASN